MTAAAAGQLLSARIPGAVVEAAYGVVTVTVPASAWVAAATTARDDDGVAAAYFDWLSAYEEVPRSAADPDGFAVVLRVWSPTHRHALLVRTLLPRGEPRLATLARVYAGAAWHERETAEMYGVRFDGHPDPRPLLLPDGFSGHPLRKEFALADRASPWPGDVHPTERRAQ